MKSHLLPALRLTLVCLVFFCGFYTLIVWSVAQLAPNQGKGLVITQNERTYYVNVGQAFTADEYFWSRPSAVDYDAAGAGGSNLGPSNPAHLAEVEQRIRYFLEHNPGLDRSQVPSDLVTASGSGLDPHISVEGARVQVKRIARLRKVPEETLRQLVDQYTEAPLLGLFGTARVHVLKINLALQNL
ncbi:K(+)-transporting ATPase subunit C [Rhabdobacter roseus]|uniref:K(+)-transporting ATPase subunit C n=1 Tax=Rhabdobacter roseus TaxID=1655419 RepID=UPI00160E2EBF